jgi:hypothetical protein
VQFNEEIGNRRRHRAGAKTRRPFDYGRCNAELACSCRHFQADPAAADHKHMLARTQPLAQRDRFIERAQVSNVRGLHQRIGQTSRRAACGDHEAIVLHFAARARAHDALFAVNRRGGIRLPRFDVQRVEVVRLDEAHGVDIRLARQHRLRQRRALIGQMDLIGDHHKAAAEAFLAQRLHDPSCCLATADHDDRARGLQACVFA